jgi:DNA-binding NarL/FixJ family response regulator
MTKIKVAIVDDEKLIIEGLKMLLEQDPEITVSNTANNGQDLFDQMKNIDFNADIILLDISMPVMDGIETMLLLNEMKLPYKVIILSSYYNDGMIIRFLDEGASAFLAKSENPDNVIDTIKNVYNKGFHINDHIMQIIRNRRLLAKTKELQEDLSEREKEVLKLICNEYTNKEIAEKLYISQRTVEGHRNRILEKIDCKNTAGMVIYAIEHKIIDITINGKYG